MVTKTVPMCLVAATLSVAFAIMPAHAACDDRPGTPDNVSAVALPDNRSIQFRWRNTATETVFWDIEVTDLLGNVVLSQTGIGQGVTGFHLPASNTYLVEPGAARCFRIRA
jgi:hypothetical protein